MIRRELRVAQRPDHWILFRQPDHAVFAGKIAQEWQSDIFVPLEPRREVLAAVITHDDGWRPWEDRPMVDAVLGRPLAFNEMPLHDSLTIWRDSIELGRKQGPLVAYAIAGHFSRLLRQFDSWREDPQKQPLAEEYLRWSDESMHTWLSEWRPDCHDCDRTIAERAVGFVRLFDALSLWLLNAERTTSSTFETPDGPAIVFSPRGTAIDVTPWPFRSEHVLLSASGRAIPVRHYRSTDDLLAEPSSELTLSWELRPGTS